MQRKNVDSYKKFTNWKTVDRKTDCAARNPAESRAERGDGNDKTEKMSVVMREKM